MTKIAKKNQVFVKKVKVKKVIEAKVKEDVLPLPMKTGNEEQEDFSQLVKPRAVTTGVYALLELIKRRENEEKKKALFKNDPKDIMLQIVPIKIPETDMQQIRVVLPHPLSIEGSDVCLITQNVKKATKNDHEPTIAYYKSLLQEKKIKGITEIVPIRQLRSEHVQFEMKGRFADMYDMFLVDGRLFGKVTKFLGSRFFKKNKDLIPVKINTNNVKEELEKALSKTVLTVHGHGDSYSVRVGFSSFTVEQLEANILAVSDTLVKSFPGGFGNIRKLLVKSDHSMAIPIYLSLTPHNSVPVPVVKPRLPKAYVPVEGELSTLIGAHVTVMPTGQVIVERSLTAEDIEMWDEEYLPWQTMAVGEKDIEEKDKEVDQKAKEKGKKRKVDDESSDDEDVEAAENAYVTQLQNEPKLSDKAKADKTKKAMAKIKPPVSKSQREVQKLLERKKLQLANNGEDQLSPVDEAPGKVGVKRKQSNVASIGKNQPETEKQSEIVEVKRKKLNDKSTKVKRTELDEQISGLKEEAVNLRPKNVKGKASPKAQVGKAKKQLKKDAKVLESPNTITKLIPLKKGAKKKRAALGSSADELGATPEMIGTKGSIDAIDVLNDMVTDQEKKIKVTKNKKSPRRESSRLSVMFNMITQSRMGDTFLSKEVNNEVDSPTISKLNMRDVMETGTNKKTKRIKAGKNSSNVQVSGSPINETTAGKKTKKRDKLATNDTTSELEASAKKMKKANKLTDATPTLRSLDFGSPPSIVAKKTKKADKRTKVGDTSMNSIPLKLQAFGSPATKTGTEKKKKKLDKRTANAQKTPTSAEKKGKRASLGKESSTLPLQGLEVPMTEEKVKKKKKGVKLAKTIDEGSVNSILRSLDVGSPTITDTKVKGKLDKSLKIKKSKRLQDKSASPALEVLTPKQKKTRQGITSQEDSSQLVKIAKALDVPIGKQESVTGNTGVKPTRSKQDLKEDLVKEKPKKIKKRKEKSIAPVESEEYVATPKTKKKKNSESNTNGPATKAASFDMTVPATVGRQSLCNSEKSSNTKRKAKGKKKNQNSEKDIVKPVVQVKKPDRRFNSEYNKQTNTILANAKLDGESVTTMPLKLFNLLRIRNNARNDREKIQ